MRWNGSSTWLGSSVWTGSDDMGAIHSAADKSIKKVVKNVDVPGLINSLSPSAIGVSTEITSDTTLDNLIPAGAYIDKVIIINNTANTGQISGGTSGGGTDIFSSLSIPPGATKHDVGKYCAAAPSIFLHHGGGGDTWNSISIDIHVIFWKL